MKGNKTISLFINTATYRFEIILLIDTKVKIIENDNNKTAVEKANILINRVLMSENIKLKDVDCFYTLLGPGSNTGVRIGLTICKTVYALNKDIKIYGINSLKLLNKGDGISLLSDRANNLYAFDSNKNKYYKIDKNRINFDENTKIYVEDLDVDAINVLKEYNPNLIIEKVNIMEQMVNRKSDFEDYSNNEENFLPLYGAQL